MLPVAPEKIKISAEEIVAGDWFLPVDREGIDQHGQIALAIRQGAAGFFYEPARFDASLFPGTASYAAESLRELLYGIAEKKRNVTAGHFAAIAGSNGKSTVKEMVAAMASAEGISFHHSPGNKNTKLALSSQMLALAPETKLAVFEVGARRVGDFSVPLRILAPQLVALLNIGRAHLGEFGSIEQLRGTKLAILRAPTAQVLVVPAADAAIQAFALAQGKKTITFGLNPSAHYWAAWEGGGLVVQGEQTTFTVPAPFAPGLPENAAAAAAIARQLGLSWSSVKKGLENMRRLPSRFERREWNGHTVIDDAFNASPESLLAGLNAVLSAHREHRLALVIGPMKELGMDSGRIHRELGAALASGAGQLRHPPLLLTVGEEAVALGEEASRLQPGTEWRALSDAAAADTFLKQNAHLWQTAFLKGSKASGLTALLRGK